MGNVAMLRIADPELVFCLFPTFYILFLTFCYIYEWTSREFEAKMLKLEKHQMKSAACLWTKFLAGPTHLLRSNMRTMFPAAA